MMPLPQGRKPLTDQDMIKLLHEIANNTNSVSGNYPNLEADLKQTADRFGELLEDGFSIESLDPDKRSWYYDGDGTRRKKDVDDV
jgi:hypothetical protein